MGKAKSKYAIPCMFTDSSTEDYEDDLFFVTFETANEMEAIALATCVTGSKKLALKSLVVITENGHVFPL
jgi:hypothetical protein